MKHMTSLISGGYDVSASDSLADTSLACRPLYLTRHSVDREVGFRGVVVWRSFLNTASAVEILERWGYCVGNVLSNKSPGGVCGR